MFKPVIVSENQFRTEQPVMQEADVKRVFMVLHGFYGNLFLSKFSTGALDDKGEDQGIANARRIWAHGLRSYDGETIKTALSACQTRHPEFPPSLPQFVSLCSAARPRAAYNAGPAAIGMSGQLRSRYAAQARAILERHAVRKVQKETGYVQLPAGLDGLKQAIAGAVAAAGGDEAKTLRRLDNMLGAAA